MKYSLTWDLDCIYPGGSTSPLLIQTLEDIENQLDILFKKWRDIDVQQFIDEFQEIQLTLSDIESFIICLASQDVTDSNAEVLHANFQMLDSKNDIISSLLNCRLSLLDEKTFEQFLKQPDNHEIEYILREKREEGKKQLAPEVESLISSLNIDGYHGWAQMFDALMGSIEIPFQDAMYSFGQIENFLSDSDRNIRREVFESISEAFDAKKTLFAQTLNHLAGYRLNLFHTKGYTQILEEPLENNRMEHETLAAMWSVIEKNVCELTKFLKRKAELLGLEKLAWYDLEAPLAITSANPHVPYEDAIQMILQCFNKELPKLATFSEHALEQGWVEAENRPGKRPGGFCRGFPSRHESRIFMTYSGTQHNVYTLAHELGHAFHNFVTHPLPEMAQRFRMNVAETASVFAENLLINTSLEMAKTEQQKIKLLDEQLSRALTFLLNIRARYLFEIAFYEERKKGYVSELRLSELMYNAQSTAYNNSLSCYHPYLWATKLHFYFSHVNFYNFPYTFGFLFSNGIYEMRHTFDNFEEKYIALLKDTGCMNVEMLAKKHLNVDLTKPEFWEKSLAPVLRNIALFTTLTEKINSNV